MGLSSHRQVNAVETDGPDLILHLRGEAVRVTSDRDHGRTVVWAPVMRVPGHALAAAAEAANRFNIKHCASAATTMGLFVEQGILLIGKSIESEEMDGITVVNEALDLIDSLAAARAFATLALESVDRAEAAPAVMAEASAVRV